MVMVIKAKYENGVFKPLEPLNIPDSQIVELRIEALPAAPRVIAQLKGIWADRVPDEDGLSFGAIQSITHDAHLKSQERLLRQIEGDFTEGNADG